MNIDFYYKEIPFHPKEKRLTEESLMEINWNRDKIIDFKNVKYGEAFMLLQDMQNINHPFFPKVMMRIGANEVGTDNIIPFHDCYNSVCLKTGAVHAIKEGMECIMVQQDMYVSL